MECSGLAVAVGLAWQTQQNRAHWIAMIVVGGQDDDNWSTLGVEGVTKPNREEKDQNITLAW